VVTSSYVAVTDITAPVSDEITEESWNPTTWEKALLNPMAAYSGSKTFAEKAAWDFLKEESAKFTVSVVNPVYVFGPQAYDDDTRVLLATQAGLLAPF
jgi:NADPH-dependent methylglyoxal reductase